MPHVVSKIIEPLPEPWLVIVFKVFAVRMVMAYMVTDRIFGRPVPVNFVRVSQVIAADLLELISGAAPFCVVVYSSTYSVWLPGIAVAVHVVMASGARWCFLQGFQGFALVQEQALVAEVETMDDKACNLAIVLCVAFVFLGVFPCNLVRGITLLLEILVGIGDWLFVKSRTVIAS